MKEVLKDILEGNELSFEDENKVLLPLLEEIDLIEDHGIMSFVRAILIRAPESFWEAPASAQMDLHPPDEHEPGGGIVHTKRVVRTALTIAISQKRSDEEKNILIAAALLHDLTKMLSMGENEYKYDPMHPYTVDPFVNYVTTVDKIESDETSSSTMWIEPETRDTIMRLIRCHMGIYSPIPETIPVTGLELTLHLADMLASRLHFLVDGSEVEEWRWIQDAK